MKKITEETIVFTDWVKARNKSCDLMERGYNRQGCKEGFVMWNVHLRHIIIIKVEEKGK